ncbi:MAG: c-type cytochrome biogenesis protein CcsB [Gracilibacteraceae bacterium]|jgi:cytochrome c-type biogenesis protein CcsB|nr:c-type cytochrome biogenesis protein CcsB [Gracilibacteraceae bacterium]
MFLYLTMIIYGLAALGSGLYMAVKQPFLGRAAYIAGAAGFAANTLLIAERALAAQRWPLANGYEFIISFCWGIVLIFLVVAYRCKIPALGAFVLPCPFLLLVFAVLIMGRDIGVVTAMPPVLKSNWLTFHVLTAVFSYGAFAVSFGLSLMYLLRSGSGSGAAAADRSARLPAPERLDDLAYRVIAFGFPLLTLVIITGAIWANYAWGTYWSWDPKETWALITWGIYAIYLHARLVLRWRGRRSAWLAVLGFIAVLFTFFGVNFLLPGLHSYA